MPHRLFDIAKVGVFCDAISHTTEKRKDDPEVKVIQLTLRVQPFDSKLAGQVRQDVRQTLFKMNSPNDPQPHLMRVNFALGVPRQNLEIFASSDTGKASILLEQVKISAVYARTEKNVNGYALVWKGTFGPASKQELEYVEAWRNSQRWVTFHEAEASLEFEEPDDDADDDDDAGDDDQVELPDPEFETDADGLPKGDAPALVRLLLKAGANINVTDVEGWTGRQFDDAAAWAREQVAQNEKADGETVSLRWPDHVSAAHQAGAEPARQRIHSHAGGKKRQAKATTDRGAAAKKGSSRK